jgi:hypothetical protein
MALNGTKDEIIGKMKTEITSVLELKDEIPKILEMNNNMKKQLEDRETQIK